MSTPLPVCASNSTSNTSNTELSREQETQSWVKLISNDHFSFILPEKAALTSGFLRSTLSANVGFHESETKVIHVNERAIILETVVEYLTFKSEFEHAQRKEDIPSFLHRIPPQLALELLMAADFLDC